MILIEPAPGVPFALNPVLVVSVRVERTYIMVKNAKLIVELANGPPFEVTYDQRDAAMIAYADLVALLIAARV